MHLPFANITHYNPHHKRFSITSLKPVTVNPMTALRLSVMICAGKFYLNFIWTNYKIFHFLNCNLGLEVEIIINLRSIQYNFLPSLKFPKEQLSEV